MRIVICGGGLQGVELCFLAKKAGIFSILVDKNPACPAMKLADSFMCIDLEHLKDTKAPETAEFLRQCHQAQIIIPALENKEILHILQAFCTENALPFAFDAKSYAISSSKLASRDFFMACNSPIAQPLLSEKDMTFPFIAKPSSGSGSEGVQVFRDLTTFEQAFPEGLNTKGWLFEAYHEGRSYSVEVCGTGGNGETGETVGKYTAYTVTALHMDSAHDCCGVSVPSGLSIAQEKAIQDEALRLAKALNLSGLMDLEVIQGEDGFIVLEIDARFPSQTPTAVYYASGINLLEELILCFIPYSAPKSTANMPYVHKEHVDFDGDGWHSKKFDNITPYVHFEHILFDGEGWHSYGEHIMRNHGVLNMETLNNFPILVGRNSTSTAITSVFYSAEITAKENYNNQLELIRNRFGP